MYENIFRISDKRWTNPNISHEEKNYFCHYLQKFINIAISRFKYKNLPEGIEERFLETYLLYSGNAIVTYDTILDQFGVFNVNLTGNIDIYGIPTEWLAVAQNEYYGNFDKENSVLFWSRPFAIPEINSIFLHCESLANMRRTRDINILQQRTPVIITGSETSKIDQDNLIKKILYGIPFIRARNDFKQSLNIESIDLKVSPQYDNISKQMMLEVSDCLNDLGIESSGFEKKERMTQDEMTRNNGEIEMTRRGLLDMREKAVKQFNDMFGSNVEVEFNSKLISDLNIAFNINDIPIEEVDPTNV